ncbi:MAG: YncE family protein [Acidobacteriia bacterium]|nr:YncE family protein [Terriglobia bacterium]
MTHKHGLAVALLSLATALAAAAQPAPGGYRLVRAIPIGGEGGWDYLTVDTVAHRLYVSHATRVEVIDTEKNVVVGAIPDTPGVHGIALAPGLGRGFTSNGRAGTVTVFDLKSLAVITTVRVTGDKPDAIAYEPTSHRVFTFNGGSANATAIEAATGQVLGTLALGGSPEFAVADGKGQMYVNLEDTATLVTFDARTLEVKGRWPLAPCQTPTGLGMDREHRRLFVGCRSKVMAVVDGDSGRVITTLPIGSGVDAVAFDPASALVFASNGDGTVTVVHEDSPEKFTLVGNVATKPGAKTLALDGTTHRIYLSTAQYGPPPSPTAEQPHPKPSILAGTFEILVLER